MSSTTTKRSSNKNEIRDAILKVGFGITVGFVLATTYNAHKNIGLTVTCEFPTGPASARSSIKQHLPAVSSAATTTTTTNSARNLINLPSGTKSIIMNIGSNLDPILPRKDEDGPCTVSIAFEPIVYSQIPNAADHRQLHIVPAAVSYNNGLATMYVYNKNAESSSLEKAGFKSNWNTGKRNNKGMKLVPILSFLDVLDSIPEEIPIKFILTDMQGHDFKTVQSALPKLRQRQVPVMRTEVYMEGITTYENTQNDFCMNWLSVMNQHGYELVEVRNMLNQNVWKGYGSQQEATQTCQDILQNQKSAADNSPQKTGLSEGEALWKLSSHSEKVTYAKYEFPVMKPNTKPFFSNQEYDQCG